MNEHIIQTSNSVRSVEVSLKKISKKIMWLIMSTMEFKKKTGSIQVEKDTQHSLRWKKKGWWIWVFVVVVLNAIKYGRDWVLVQMKMMRSSKACFFTYCRKDRLNRKQMFISGWWRNPMESAYEVDFKINGAITIWFFVVYRMATKEKIEHKIKTT